MTPRQRGAGSGTDGDSDAPRTPRVRPVDDVKGAEDAVEETSLRGRSTADGGTGAGTPAGSPSSGSTTNDLVTAATGLPGGTPVGNPTAIPRKSDAETRRSLEMENSGAVTIAGAGYRIQQNPSRDEVARARQATGDAGDPHTNPDYLIEGRVFDCYSPTSPLKAVRGIWSEVEEKIVERQQAQRAVVNLEDWTGDLAALRQQFRDWPIEGLKEVKAILPSGEIVQIDLPPTS